MILKSLNSFYRIVDSNETEINEIILEITKYYYEYSKIKSDGISKRYFNPSINKLKDIQNKIQGRILSKLVLVDNVLGGVKGWSNIDNAKLHYKNKYFFQTDLNKFFPSVSQAMIINSLIAKGFSKAVAEKIANLCVLSTKDGHRDFTLPQGAPTSPMLANLVFEKIDIEILKLIKNRNIIYSRWIDDLTFSSKEDMKYLNLDIIRIITDRGVKISRKKTTYRIGSCIITGVLIKKGRMTVTKEFDMQDESKMNMLRIKGRENYRKQVHKKNR
ncbi:reverse transcriptase family protein [Epilithonimonas sp.]|uniref:reverse transcriptase family protein n=1 Tax=Epilithonimonas sp. TaxID=2894511 RepID=UPI0028AE7DFD|nr:reverse transcriptase family protein [Epilithonimonas sp.]